MKINQIETLSDNYLIVNHPFPQVEGEMLIYQKSELEKGEKLDDDLLLYKDYSLKKRIKTQTNKFPPTTAQQKKIDEMLTKTTKIQQLEVENHSPLSPCDWKQIATIVSEVDALTWVQFLPVGQKSS